MNPSSSKFDEEELTTLVQVLFVWLIEKKYHSIYLNKMIHLMNILMEPRHHAFLINVLFKLNMVSIFHEMYFVICTNGVFQHFMHAEQSILIIRVFVNRVSSAIKKSKPTDTIATLNNMPTWIELKQEIKKLISKNKSEKKKIQKKVLKMLVKRMTENFPAHKSNGRITDEESSGEEIKEEEISSSENENQQEDEHDRINKATMGND